MLTFNFHMFLLSCTVLVLALVIIGNIVVAVYHRWWPMRLAATVMCVLFIGILAAVLA